MRFQRKILPKIVSCTVLVTAMLCGVPGPHILADSWPAFEHDVFETIEAMVGRIDPDGAVTAPDLQGFSDRVAGLASRWGAIVKANACPSPEICQSFRELILRSEQIAEHQPGTRYLPEEWEGIALLRQALSHYRQHAAAPPAATGSGQHSPASTPSAAPAATNPLASSQDAIGFKLQYRYKSGGQGEFQPLRDGAVMQSGDYYQIAFVTDEACSVYIFQIDATGKMFGIFPLRDFKGVPVGVGNPVTPKQVYMLPSKDQSFVLDQQTGQETIYFLAFREPNPRLEALYQEVLTAQNTENPKQIEAAQQRLLNEIHTKGIAGIADNAPQAAAKPSTAGSAAGGQATIVTEMLQQMQICDGCVSIVRFTHQ